MKRLKGGLFRGSFWILLPAILGAIAGYTLVASDRLDVSVFGDERESVVRSGSTIPDFSAQEIDAIMSSEFPAYGVGQQYDRLPLVHTNHVRVVPPAGVEDIPTNEVHYIYGDCTPSGGDELEGGTCVAPLEIVTRPYCSRRPEFIPVELKDGDEFAMRGARAQWIKDPSDEGHLRLYARDVTITVYATNRDTALNVAKELRSMTPGLGVEDSRDDLGSPASNAC